MSSNEERAPKIGAQAGAEEAVVDFLLTQIGKRAPSPTQAVKACQILGLATRENIKKVRDFRINNIIVIWWINNYDINRIILELIQVLGRITRYFNICICVA